MKTPIALTVAALVALALPAQAQVVIEEAPGAGDASMEPTFFLNTETARILPANLNVVSLGFGGLFPTNGVNLQVGRGFGAGGEFKANFAYMQFTGFVPTPAPGNVPPPGPLNPTPIGGGLGYKQRLAIAGPFDIALNAYGSVYLQGAPMYGVLVGLPFTTMLGPGDLTLQPRALMPDLAKGLNASIYGLTAGYRLPLGPVRFLFEGTAAVTQGGLFAPQGKVGLRYAALPNLHFDLQAGLDLLGAGAHPANPENGLASAAVRFSL